MRLTGDQKNFEKKIRKKSFGFFFQFFPHAGTVEENTLKSFCYFWALDMAPTWAVSGLFYPPPA